MHCGFTMPTVVPNLIIIIIMVLFLQPLFTTADIRNIKITSDPRHGILFQKFGFTESGHISISIESATFNSAVGDPSRLGFFIIPSKDTMFVDNWTYLDLNSDCLLDRKGVQILFNFTQLIPPFSQSFPIMLPDEYSLYFANCQPESRVTMSVATEMYNLNNNGAFKDYLPVGQTQLDILYVVFAAIYFVFCLVWVDVSADIRKKHFWIIFSMGGLILMKTLSLICAAVDQHYVKFTGMSHGWDVVVSIFQVSRVILLCCVIAQIGIGWSILHPRVVQITMMILLPLLVITDIALTVLVETRPYLKNWIYLRTKYLSLSGGFSCGIFVTIFSWSICLFILPDRLERTAPKTKGGYYVLLYIVMSGWFLSTLLPVCKTDYDYKLQLVFDLLEEIATLVTYVGTFCIFGHAIHTNAIPVANRVEEGSASKIIKIKNRHQTHNPGCYGSTAKI